MKGSVMSRSVACGRHRRRGGVAVAALLGAAGLSGWSAEASVASAPASFVALGAPARVLDSRVGESTADGGFAGAGRRVGGSVLELPVGGRVGVPDDAVAVVANVTVVGPSGVGYATVFPCGEARPEASNLNYVAGQTVANLVVGRLGSGGGLCVFTLRDADVVVDVSGYFVEGSFVALGAPARVLDSRVGESTADGGYAGIGALVAGSSLELTLADRVGVPGDAVAVVANLTVTQPAAAGHATVYPSGAPRPNASNLNYLPDATVAVAVVLPLGADGNVCLATHAAAHYIVDVTGYFVGTPPASSDGGCAGGGAVPPSGVPLPPEAQPVDTADPDTVIGTGTPASCTSTAVVAAVAGGGVITFDCGPAPVVIEMLDTAKVINTSPDVVIDGGGLVTLSGRGDRRILYQNTCDPAQTWTTSHCNDQAEPRLVVQNIGFTAGNSTGDTTDGGGGGAIFVRGGRLKVLNATFTGNRCDATGPDVGGAAIRVLDQFHDLPVIVAGSVFGGSPAAANECSNGGAVSSIGVSWEIYNSLVSHNRALGSGANPARPGTPGGGNGGALYFDGNAFDVRVVGSEIADNVAPEGGGAVFFVSNDRTGHLTIDRSTLRRNPSLGFESAGYPGVFYLGDGPPTVVDSTLR